MKQRINKIDKLLETNSRRELIEQAINWHKDLSLPDAQVLTKHLNTLEPPEHTFRLGFIHTYTSDLLNPWLNFHAAVQGLALNTYHAPYGLNIMESQEGSGLSSHKPDLTLFLLTRADLHPELTKPISGLDPEQLNGILEEAVSRLMEILARFRANISGRIGLTILPRILPVALGLYDAQADHSENAWWNTFKKTIASELASSIESSMFFDLDQILLELGRAQFFDSRFWYTSRFPFTPQAASELARRIISLSIVSKSPKAKVITLDADNTLWGGIVGEDGINGIALGPDYPGNTYVDFQHRILDFQRRGFILALCSKNNPEDVQEVLRDHPHQVLREHHFAAMRVNWLPKHENLLSLAKDLNLGVESFIFVDDSDHECAAIRSHLPQVQVIQTPTKPVDIPACLEQLPRLEILSLTKEDLQKTKLYAQEQQRQILKKDMGTDSGSIRDYLISLKMKMNVSIDSKEQLSRLTQLTQKTNQFNLTTRRYNEQQMLHFIESAEWTVFSFSLADIFGDSGIVGLALCKHLNNSEIEIDTFLMSCRVIGRQAESGFLESILGYLASNGITKVLAHYIKTPKNKLVEKFYSENGFLMEEIDRYTRNLSNSSVDKDQIPPIEVNIIV